MRFCIMEWHQLKSPHLVSTSKTILVLLLARERQGEGKTRCTSQWLFLEEKKKILGELILNVRHCSFVVQLLPSNPVFVLPTIATEVFHFIYLLFISLQLPNINARQASEAFFSFFFSFSYTRFISPSFCFATTSV